MKREVIGGVYSITIVNEDINYMYIGSSKNIHRRISENNIKLKKGVHHCSKLQELYNKGHRHYIEILEYSSNIRKLINTEAEYIEHFKRIDGIEVLNVMEPYIPSKRVYLSIAKVVQVKKLLAQGLEPKEVSEITGVKRQQVYRIKSNSRWSSVKVVDYE
jgi:hypothetical protein